MNVDGRKLQKTTNVVKHSPRQAGNSRTKKDWAGRDRTPPNQYRTIESLEVSQRGARLAVEQLQPHNIGYPQLLDESISPILLRELYPALRLSLSGPSKLPVSSVDTKPQQTSAPARPEQSSGSSLLPITTSESSAMTLTATEPQSQYRESVQNRFSRDPQIEHGVDTVEKDIDQSSHRAQNDGQGQVSNTVLEKPVAADKSPLLPGIGSRSGSGGIQATQKLTLQPPSVNGNKPVTQTVQPLANPASGKMTVSKATQKPVDRKDYIARLLAAKAGKALPTINASKPSPDPASQESLQNSSAKAQDEESNVTKPNLAQVPNNETLDKAGDSSDMIKDNATLKSVTVEVKKREQTELARRKIEELRKRSEALKKAPPPVNEALSPSSLEEKHPIQAPAMIPPERNATPFTSPPQFQNISQHSYFPLQNAAFAIPGLFLSSQQTQPDLQSEISPQKIASAATKLASFPGPEIFKGVDTSITPQPSVSVTETSAPFANEPKNVETAPAAGIEIPKPVTSLRKRPTAVDFIESVPSKSRKIGNAKADNRVIFEVSDDEGDEPLHNTSEIQLNGQEGMKLSQVEENQNPHTERIERANFRQHPSLSDLRVKSEMMRSTATSSPQTVQIPLKLKEPEGLRSKEEEIARMNRKIAEMEQRRKSKQVASRAHTPGTPIQTIPSVTLVDNIAKASKDSSSIRRFSEPTSRIEEGKRILNASQEPESVTFRSSPPRERVQSTEPTSSTANEAESTVAERRRRRRAEIETMIPSVNAIVQDYTTRLQNLQKEEADLQAQIQTEIDGKRALQEELDLLLQVSLSTPKNAEKTVGEASKGRISSTNQSPVSAGMVQPSTQVHSPRSPETLRDKDLSAEKSSAPKSATPEISSSIEALSNRSSTSGELAEDIMDISGSEDDIAITEDGPLSDTNETPAAVESDIEEAYEPPVAFEITQEDPLPSAEPESRNGDDETRMQQAPPGSQLLPTQAEISEEADLPDAVNVDETGHVSSHVDMSDSDVYEPPEPPTPVDVPPSPPDAGVATSETSFSPANADQNTKAEPTSPDGLILKSEQAAVETAETETNRLEEASVTLYPIRGRGHFTPYESPLQRFHAYRYHPDFVSRVGSGYRSMTYSHNIDARKPICPYEIGGRCNDPSCENQHFKNMNLSGAFGEQDDLRVFFAYSGYLLFLCCELTQVSNFTDDLILVQMGSVPEGLSAEQKDAFVVGLRQIIQEIRGRKVKDFRTVASEIAAYRARFLGDSSKVLPL
ncbi:MAG: hypothetical protein Q9219_005904 [cf. Caloplaca sp. 3 TL-2023]